MYIYFLILCHLSVWTVLEFLQLNVLVASCWGAQSYMCVLGQWNSPFCHIIEPVSPKALALCLPFQEITLSNRVKRLWKEGSNHRHQSYQWKRWKVMRLHIALSVLELKTSFIWEKIKLFQILESSLRSYNCI